jgi:hypothetical protein
VCCRWARKELKNIVSGEYTAGQDKNKLLVVKITGNNIAIGLYRLAGDVRCRNGRGKANGDNDDVNSQDKLRKSKRIKQMEGTE